MVVGSGSRPEERDERQVRGPVGGADDAAAAALRQGAARRHRRDRHRRGRAHRGDVHHVQPRDTRHQAGLHRQ